MSLEKLLHELIEKVYNITIKSNDNIIQNEKERALEIINELKDHINDKIKVSNNLKMTVLDCIIRCDSQGNVRLNNRSLIDLEEAVKKIGGKTSQELRQKQSVNERDNRNISDYNRKLLFKEEDWIGVIGSGLWGGFVFQGIAIGFACLGNVVMAAVFAVLALVTLAALTIALCLFIKGNSTSTNLDRTTMEQHHTQGTESTLRA